TAGFAGSRRPGQTVLRLKPFCGLHRVLERLIVNIQHPCYAERRLRSTGFRDQEDGIWTEHVATWPTCIGARASEPAPPSLTSPFAWVTTPPSNDCCSQTASPTTSRTASRR